MVRAPHDENVGKVKSNYTSYAAGIQDGGATHVSRVKVGVHVVGSTGVHGASSDIRSVHSASSFMAIVYVEQSSK